ncbi:MAG: exodeoxyribonuclease VII large subunit [Alistipes sp.]|nr:exodeoxyribonuclease VII large subunit [Alistipes sp.]
MASETHFTLKELQRRIKLVIDEHFALPVWVSAEISEIKVNYSGHCYLELIEKSADDGLPAAQARAVIWRSQYPRIAAAFEAGTGQRLAAGIRVLVKALVTYHELYGFSLQISDIDSSYTLGDLERQRQQTIALLQQDGVWEMNRLLAWPEPAQRIAVVSSTNAAGYQDFCNELAKSPYWFEVTLFDAFMQGAAAEDSIVAALCAVADRQDDFDVAVLIRGGGSRNDLACFDSYRLCTYIAQFPLPVLTGIGHDKDTSVADMVAHTALKTPTAVAGRLVELMAEAKGALDLAALQLHDAVQETLHAAAVQLERFGGQLRETSATFFTRRNVQLEHAAEWLSASVRELLERQKTKLDAAAKWMTGYAPERILRLGFAVVRKEGRACRSTTEIQAGDRLSVELADGRFDAIARPKRK